MDINVYKKFYLNKDYSFDEFGNFKYKDNIVEDRAY